MRTNTKNGNTSRTRRVISTAAVLAVGLIVGHVATKHGYTGVATPSSIICINTDTINKIGMLNEVMHDNSDTMMRFAHYLNPHTSPILMCPECGGRHNVPERAVYIDPVDDGQGTIDDLRSDATELNKSVTRILTNLLHQNETLGNTLQKLREGSHSK